MNFPLSASGLVDFPIFTTKQLLKLWTLSLPEVTPLSFAEWAAHHLTGTHPVGLVAEDSFPWLPSCRSNPALQVHLKNLFISEGHTLLTKVPHWWLLRDTLGSGAEVLQVIRASSPYGRSAVAFVWTSITQSFLPTKAASCTRSYLFRTFRKVHLEIGGRRGWGGWVVGEVLHLGLIKLACDYWTSFSPSSSLPLTQSWIFLHTYSNLCSTMLFLCLYVIRLSFIWVSDAAEDKISSSSKT